jgi:hypothetical protein
MKFIPKYRTGGDALDFYAVHVIWLANAMPLKKGTTITGNITRAKISKNKLTGKVRECSFPIYNDYGVDDIGACIDYLVYKKVWKKPEGAQKIKAPEIKLDATKDKIIRVIEKDRLEMKVRRIAAQKWLADEEALKLKRKPRF